MHDRNNWQTAKGLRASEAYLGQLTPAPALAA